MGLQPVSFQRQLYFYFCANTRPFTATCTTDNAGEKYAVIRVPVRQGLYQAVFLLGGRPLPVPGNIHYRHSWDFSYSPLELFIHCGHNVTFVLQKKRRVRSNTSEPAEKKQSWAKASILWAHLTQEVYESLARHYYNLYRIPQQSSNIILLIKTDS